MSHFKDGDANMSLQTTVNGKLITIEDEERSITEIWQRCQNYSRDGVLLV
jgi:hypothetical protein